MDVRRIVEQDATYFERDSKLEGDNRKQWVSPFLWPPAKWRLTRGMQTISDLGAAIVFVALLATSIFGVFSWFHLLLLAGHSMLASESENLRNYLLSLGALLGVPFIIWRTLIAAQQAAINRESLYTQLFTSGVERLGAEKVVKVLDRKLLYKKKNGEWERDDEGKLIPAVRPDGKPLEELHSYERTETNIEVRLGAVYALERVAQDSKRDSRPIVETLAAYVRNVAKNQDGEAPASDEMPLPGHRPDVQAALEVIGRLNSFIERRHIDLSSTDLSFYDVSGDMKKVDFSNSILNGGHIKNVSFDGAKFNNSQISILNIEFSSFLNAKFIQANLIINECLNCSFKSAKFFSVHIEDSLFISSDFFNSQLPNAIIEKTFFRKCHFISSDFQESKLSGCSFQDCNLFGINFKNADLRYTDFSSSQVADCDFDGANLSGVSLPENADIDWTRCFTVTDEWLHEKNDGRFSSLFSLDFEITQAWREWLNSREERP